MNYKRIVRILIQYCFIAIFLFSCGFILGHWTETIKNSRNAILWQEGTDFSILIDSEEGWMILFQEFNPSYDTLHVSDVEIVETVNESINQLGKMIAYNFGNGQVECSRGEIVRLKNFTKQEVIEKMVEFVADSQEYCGLELDKTRKEVFENVLRKYNTGL